MDLNKILQKELKKITSRQTKILVADKAAEIIKTRTRDGKGVESIGQDKPNTLKPLSAATILRRKRKNLSASTTPETSNLTETGEMLDSIKGGLINNQPVVEYSSDEAARKAEMNRDSRSFEILARSEVLKIIDFINKIFRRQK